MAYYKDLREFIQLLEERGKLYRYREPINKDTELIPFHRIQMRGLPDEERRAILFENPVGTNGRTYDMSVLVGVYAASEKLMALAMGCESYQEAIERFHQGLANPIPPVIVDDGPVHEEVHVGDELKELGLDEIPVPVEEVGFSGIIRTGLPMLSKDPETGNINLGTYNGFLRARDRLAAAIGFHRTIIRDHWVKHAPKGEGVPVAIIIGPVPAIMAASSAEIPYGQPGLDELTLAGGIAGEPIELVRCKTVPLEVPAQAEMIIEGYVSHEDMELRLPFGEYPGYMAVDKILLPVIHVTAITHRKNAMFTDIIVGVWPSDCNVVWAYAHNSLMYHHLKYEHNLPVEEVYYPQEAGALTMCLIRVSDGVAQETVEQVLQTAADHPRLRSKYLIVVDSDTDLRDHENLVWSLAFRTQPQEDIRILPTGGSQSLDPSSEPAGTSDGKLSLVRSREPGGPRQFSRVLINATRKFHYPPVALPQKQYMEKALEMWRSRGDLPEPHLRWPWHGYTLGYWPEDLEEYAELIAQGEYLKVGEMTAKLQQKVPPAPPG